MRRHDDDERGSVTAFVVVFSLALLMVVGLVIDGGFLLAARRQAINEAEAAARAGAQAVMVDSSKRLDPVRSERLARDYLARTGHDGSVTVVGDTITVEVRFRKDMTILGAGGLGSVDVHGRGEAHGARGAVQEGDV